MKANLLREIRESLERIQAKSEGKRIIVEKSENEVMIDLDNALNGFTPKFKESKSKEAT